MAKDKLLRKKINIQQATTSKITREVLVDTKYDEEAGQDVQYFIEVKGLSTNDIAFLFTQAPDVWSYLLDGVDFQGWSNEKVVNAIMQKVPGLAYIIVGLGVDDVENAGMVGELNVSVVADLLQAVFDLTIPEDVNQLKKLLAMMNSIYLSPKNP